MSENNGNQEPSTAPSPDFGKAMKQAAETGDFDYVLKTATESKRMLLDFREAILESNFLGRHSTPVAMGLNFLNGMINQATSQLAMLKQTEKATREAIKAKPPTDIVS